MEKGLSTEALLDTLTRPRLALYSYLTERKKFQEAVKLVGKGGAIGGR